jgi:hypothetical protein
MNWILFIIYRVIKGVRDGHESNYFLGASIVEEIHGMHFFEKRSRKLMLVRHKLRGFTYFDEHLDREAGDRYRLPDFVAQNGPSLKRQYRKLSDAEKKNLTKDIETVREQRVKVCRSNPKAVQKDVNAAFSNMEHEVCGIQT